MTRNEFNSDLDNMVGQGVTVHPEYNIDLGAFQFVRRIKSKLKTANTLFYVFLGLFSFLMIGIVFLYICPQYLSALGFNVSRNEVPPVILDSTKYTSKITELLSENEALKIKIEELDLKEDSIKAMTSDERLSDSSKGKDNVIRHVVEQGETLYSLAVMYYGSGRMLDVLMGDNNLSDPGELSVGATLLIYPDKKLENF